MSLVKDNIQSQLAAMERELLALSANQAPAPRQITTFSHSVNLAVGENNFTIVFATGVKLLQVYSTNTTYFTVTVDGQDVSLFAFRPNDSAASTLTVVSLSEFSIV